MRREITTRDGREKQGVQSSDGGCDATGCNVCQAIPDCSLVGIYSEQHLKKQQQPGPNTRQPVGRQQPTFRECNIQAHKALSAETRQCTTHTMRTSSHCLGEKKNCLTCTRNEPVKPVYNTSFVQGFIACSPECMRSLTNTKKRNKNDAMVALHIS